MIKVNIKIDTDQNRRDRRMSYKGRAQNGQIYRGRSQ